MIKTSITAIEQAGWNTPLVLRGDFKDSIALASALGYEGIEMHLPDSDTLDKQGIRSALRSHRMELTSIGTGPSYSQNGIFLTSSSPEVRKEAIRRMKGHIRFASDHGAVVIIGLIKGQKKDCREPDQYMGYFRAGMDECIKEAEKQSVIMAFEVIDRFESDWLNTVDEGLELLDYFRSDKLTLHLDTFHMNIEEPDSVKSILKAGNRIGHVHVADSDRWYPGHAHYDFEAAFAALRQVGYAGAAALESFLYPDPKTSARLALDKINPLCG